MKTKNLTGATILITGGTGSFGNRVGAHLLKYRPAEIRIYSRDEKKQWEMQRTFPQLRYIIGDVRDADRLNEAMRGVDYVFHAAALKQVPSCEDYPYEAVKTNVLGSQNACNAAKANGVKTFVALSTDKAVKPVNAMGISKAMMEKIVCSQNQMGGKTVFCCVRYGNVMGSRGSVIPLFREADRGRQTADSHRAPDDAFPAHAGSVGRPGAACDDPGARRRDFRAQGSRLHRAIARRSHAAEIQPAQIPPPDRRSPGSGPARRSTRSSSMNTRSSGAWKQKSTTGSSPNTGRSNTK